MVSEKNNDKMRNKAEEILDNRFDRIKKISADDTEIIHELRVYQTEERYREIFVDNPAVMMILDPSDGAIIDANPAASNFYGYSLDELVKMKISDINVTDEFIQDMQQAESNQKNLMVLEHRLSNGNIRNVNVQSGIIAHKGGNVLCSIIQDITAQKKAEMSLRERNDDIHEMLSIEKYDHAMAENKLEELIDTLEISNKAIEQFAYVSSHDLREPLRMITSFLQLLKRRYTNELDDDANDFINYAVEGAKRLDMMINDLLEFSEIGPKKEN